MEVEWRLFTIYSALGGISILKELWSGALFGHRQLLLKGTLPIATWFLVL